MPRQKIHIPEKPNISFEENLWNDGIHQVAGLDEAGRGAWAGPVYAAAVVLPTDARILQLLSGVRDSKRMTSKQRDHWRACICSSAVDWAVAFASNAEIDAQGIVAATCLAMNRAVLQLKHPPQHLLVDFITIPDCSFPQSSIPKGDAISLSIAAASVLAKTTRDALMVEMDMTYPGYGFAKHKGYGTRQHRAALYKKEITTIHRVSYRPMKYLI